MKPVQDGAVGSQNFWPERVALERPRGRPGVGNALAWWSNHQ